MSLWQEIIVDNFAGGGGASTGISLAIGRSVDIAINHDPAAIAMHKANHPFTEHYCESVWDIDPREVVRGRQVALCWLSPNCKHFSKAKGGKPVEKHIRGLAWVAVRWAATVRPRVIILENVEEFKTWGPLIPKRDLETGRMLKIMHSEDDETDVCFVAAEPGEFVPPEERVYIPDPQRKGITFKAFVNALKRQGYQVDWKELRACDYGAPTTRKRFFLIARCDGNPIVWPTPTHGDPESQEVKSGKLKPWRTAAEIIDWSLPCPSIFERKKSLAENTLRRIARGIQRFVLDNPKPFIVQVNYSGAQHHYCRPLDKPLSTITAKNGWGLVSPFIARIGQTGFDGNRMQYQVEEPLTTVVTKAEHLLVTPTLMVNTTGHPGSQVDAPIRTITTGNHHALVAAFLSKYHGETSPGEVRGQLPDEPIRTIDTSNRFSLVTSHLIKLRGTGQGMNIGHPVTEPLHTVSAGGNHIGEVRAFLLKYYGAEQDGQACTEPLHTITAKHKFGLVTIHGQDYQIVDIGMRMLEPHELFAAQGFPDSYIIDRDYEGSRYSKAAQVARCGNAVPPPFAEHLVRANLPELCTGYKPARKGVAL